MEAIKELLGNYVLTVAILSWLAAQVLKTIIDWIVNKKVNLERMVGAGGMPSCHSSMVCALTIATAKECGVNSAEFALAFMFACVVMYDAMGVRRAAGEQARMLNKLVFGFSKSERKYYFKRKKSNVEEIEIKQVPSVNTQNISYKPKLLKEFLGHTPMEVLGGALLGILVAMIVPNV